MEEDKSLYLNKSGASKCLLGIFPLPSACSPFLTMRSPSLTMRKRELGCLNILCVCCISNLPIFFQVFLLILSQIHIDQQFWLESWFIMWTVFCSFHWSYIAREAVRKCFPIGQSGSVHTFFLDQNELAIWWNWKSWTIRTKIGKQISCCIVLAY